MIHVEYSGDSNYPPSSYDKILNVSYYGVIGFLSDDGKVILVSLMLPANATGNLTVFNDNRKLKVASTPMVNGKASIDLTDLPIGIYDLRAFYEGSDYEVRPYYATFKVFPTIIITPKVVTGQNANVFMDLDNSTGYMLIVIDNVPAIQEIKDGVINYTFSTKGFVVGNHTISFQYFGESFDKDLLNEYDESTGRYTPIEYTMEVLPMPIEYNITVDDNNIITIEMPAEADGIITVINGSGDVILEFSVNKTGKQFINGTEITISIINGTKYIVIDFMGRLSGDLAESGGNLTFIFSESEFYQSFSAKVPIKGNTKPRIVAGDFTMQYTAAKKYSVTVYGANGKAASGVKVTFLVNNKSFGSATTNANGIASIVITQKPGTYKITAKALDVSTTKKLTVSHILTLKKAKVKRSAKKLVIKATLKKVNGKSVKGKKITFKFNGKKYSAKTNKKGVAKVTIKKKVLKKLKAGKKVKYQAKYLKDTVKKSVKVKK
jgi:hypothetical protein